MSDLIERLMSPSGWSEHDEAAMSDAADEIDRLTTQLAEAREALAPFARHAEKYEHALYPDSHGILGPMVEPSIKVGDFRRAARALRALTSPAQPGAEIVGVPANSARDWTEDFTHENGNYICRCSSCGEPFWGHKRRSCCRTCAQPGAETMETPDA